MSENEAGTWQRRPFVISPLKGSVFVGGWLPDHASTPCCIASLTWNELTKAETMAFADQKPNTYIKKKTKQWKKTSSGRSFTSIQMFHTHLLRTIFANSDVECILRAKTLQLHLTGMGRWKDPRKIESNIAMSSARWNKLTDCDNCAEKRSGIQIDMPVLGLAGCHRRQIGKWKIAGTFSPPCCLVFVGHAFDSDGFAWPPAVKNRVEVLHPFRCSTHTHTLPREGGKIKVRAVKWKWKRKEWRWGEDENEMKIT